MKSHFFHLLQHHFLILTIGLKDCWTIGLKVFQWVQSYLKEIYQAFIGTFRLFFFIIKRAFSVFISFDCISNANPPESFDHMYSSIFSKSAEIYQLVLTRWLLTSLYTFVTAAWVTSITHSFLFRFLSDFITCKWAEITAQLLSFESNRHQF